MAMLQITLREKVSNINTTLDTYTKAKDKWQENVQNSIKFLKESGKELENLRRNFLNTSYWGLGAGITAALAAGLFPPTMGLTIAAGLTSVVGGLWTASK